MLKGNAELFCLSWTKKCVVPESGVFNMCLYHKAHKLFFCFLMCSFFFFCIIAKPKNKESIKIGQNIPFSMQTKNQVWQRRGRKRGYFLLKAAAVLKSFTFSLWKRFFTFFAFWTAVGTHFFMLWVHSKVTAILSLCDVALNQLIASEWQVWADVSRKVSAI